MSWFCARSWSWCKLFSGWVSQPCRSYKPFWPPKDLRSFDSCTECGALFQCRWCDGRPCQRVEIKRTILPSVTREDFPTV